jgi:YD repeat-containing protein
LPTQIVEPGRTTTFTYDTNGRVLTKTETDTTTQSVPYSTNGQTRTWTFTWDATGLLLSVNGPRTDVADTTTYAWNNGVLASVTNALGQAVQINAVTQRGLPATTTDPNGVVTNLTYDQRGRLTGVTRQSPGGDSTTRLVYDAVGLVTAIILPDGTRLDYEYDNARRLTAVHDALGQRIEYTLDAMGNRTAEKIKSSGGTILKSMTHAYDELGRLLQSVGAASETTSFSYDNVGNVVAVTDPLGGASGEAYDALNHLIHSTDPASGTTYETYNAQDNLTSVTDPRSVATNYVYDGFGRRIETVSPDAGTTVYQYDRADDLTQVTDGRGVVTTYSYDAVGRVTTKSFPAGMSENVSYSYDDSTPGHYGVGHLATIIDDSGSTAFVYDARGNVVQETCTIGGVPYVTTYGYDVADRLTRMVYPSGRIVSYQRDALGRVTGVTTQANDSAAPVTVAANITYLPFGPIASLTYGNGLTRTWAYDSDYRLSSLSTSGGTNVQNLSYSYDAASNILGITDALAAGRSQSFTYDSLFRLTQATGAYGTIGYGYDAVGNRTSETGSVSKAYSYDAFSNRLLSVNDGTTTRSFNFDNAGNTIGDAAGGSSFDLAYNKANRLSQMSLNGTPSEAYTYNALGERVAKMPPGRRRAPPISTTMSTASCWQRAMPPAP